LCIIKVVGTAAGGYGKTARRVRVRDATVKNERGTLMDSCRQNTAGVNGTHAAAVHELNAAIIDALTANIALIAPDGEIVTTNSAWNQFARMNGAPEEANCYLHANYLEVCRKAVADGDANAAAALEGIGSVLSGQCARFAHEYRCDAPDENRWFLMRATPVPHGSGAVVVAHEDITAQRRVEEEIKAYSERLEELVAERTKALHEAQEELIRNERLALLGQFAGSVGHELRNPLGVISNAVYYLQAVLENPDRSTREYLDMISHEVRNAEKTICDLLELSRNRPPEKRLVSLQEMVNEALLTQASWGNVHVRSEVPADLPLVRVDPRQVVQVLANIISNAFHAMPDGGCLTFTVGQSDGSMALDVTDTGIGMPPELVAKIFEPLVSTKPRGIGLGLTLSRRLAELNQARIEVESSEGKGSRFRIVFPPVCQESVVAQG